MDVEAKSLGNEAGIARRGPAIKMLQQWAAKTHRTVQIVFTIGVEPWGLPANCFNVLKSAAAHGVQFTVNIVAFDYCIEASETGSIRALHRDSGGCLGKIDSNHCSGIKQPTWAFSHILEPFTR